MVTKYHFLPISSTYPLFPGLNKAASEDPLGQLSPLNYFGWSHGYFRRPERKLSVIRLKRKNSPDESEYPWTPAQWFMEHHRLGTDFLIDGRRSTIGGIRLGG